MLIYESWQVIAMAGHASRLVLIENRRCRAVLASGLSGGICYCIRMDDSTPKDEVLPAATAGAGGEKTQEVLVGLV